MHLIPLKSRIIEIKDNLIRIVLEILEQKKLLLQEKDILVITSKVVALAEGRVVNLNKVKVTEAVQTIPEARFVQSLGKKSAAFKQLVLDEADQFLDGENVYLTLKDKILIPHSGIDLSNAPEGMAILWPEDSFASAEKICQFMKNKFNLNDFGVVIIDSHCQPLRTGVVGIALGWHGIEGIEDERGQKDLYGKTLNVTQKNSADQLASAASLLMGEGSESIPFVLVQNAPIRFSKKRFNPDAYYFAPADDLFAGIYNDKILKN